MPMGYAVTTALLTWCTFFAVVAPRRPRPLATMSFWFGMVLNEVPFLGMFAVVASTALAAGQGDLESPASKVTVAVALATIPGMAVSAWRGLRTDQVVGRALEEGLGADWRDRVHIPLRRRRPWARILLLSRLMRRRGVERISNISYGDAGRRNLLDIYRRRDTPQNGPVLIYFHGGHYTSGAKSREARPLLYRLADQGWVCISANYRLRPQTDFPGHQIDAKKVIAWAREHASEYGADPSRLFVAGSSAGSNLAAHCALTPNDPVYQPGFESADTSVTAAICLYGYYGHFFGEEPDAARPRTNRMRTSTPVRHRFSSPTAPRTRWRRSRAPGTSSTGCAVSRTAPLSTPNCPAHNTRSTCSTPRASKPSWTASKPSPPGSWLLRGVLPTQPVRPAQPATRRTSASAVQTEWQQQAEGVEPTPGVVCTRPLARRRAERVCTVFRTRAETWRRRRFSAGGRRSAL